MEGINSCPKSNSSRQVLIEMRENRTRIESLSYPWEVSIRSTDFSGVGVFTLASIFWLWGIQPYNKNKEEISTFFLEIKGRRHGNQVIF